MTWFKISDDAADHPKMLSAGKNGRLLWLATGIKCAQASTDGFVNPVLLRTIYGALAEVPWRKASTDLVASGLWHDSATVGDCDRCSAVIGDLPNRPGRSAGGTLEGGWFYFHDWADYQLDKRGNDDQLHRDGTLRNRALTESAYGKKLRAEVQTRDQNMCRYCGLHVVFGGQDRKSASVGTIDHVDPLDFTSGKRGNSLKNCVVACNSCNGLKGQRTPEQWVVDEPEQGRLLMAPPGKYRATTTSRDQPPITPGSAHDQVDGVGSPSRDARPRAGADPDRDLVGSGAGLGRSGCAPALVGSGADVRSDVQPTEGDM